VHPIRDSARAALLLAVAAAACGRVGFDPIAAAGPDGSGTPDGVGTADAPSELDGGTGVVDGPYRRCAELKSDEYQTCALRDGEVWCWGDNADGQLGTGGIGGISTTPQPVLGLPTGVVEHDLGAFHACARTDAEVWCWGRLDVEMPAPTPYRVAAPPDPAELACGGYHACLRTRGGEVWCWGRNVDGQLGLGGTGGFVATPTRVPGLAGVTALAAGGFHTCAARTDGSVSCWGQNSSGQVGDGTFVDPRPAPTAVVAFGAATLAKAVTAGDWFTCARLADKTVRCWGQNGYGQLGAGAVGPDRSSPVAVAGLAAVADVFSSDDTSCAIVAGGALSCWGNNFEGQIGEESLIQIITYLKSLGDAR